MTISIGRKPAEIQPLTPGAKIKVALDDSFDPSAFLVAGVFAGVAMAQDQYSSFGPGAQGFGKYYGGAFADQAIGNIQDLPEVALCAQQACQEARQGSCRDAKHLNLGEE